MCTYTHIYKYVNMYMYTYVYSDAHLAVIGRHIIIINSKFISFKFSLSLSLASHKKEKATLPFPIHIL